MLLDDLACDSLKLKIRIVPKLKIGIVSVQIRPVLHARVLKGAVQRLVEELTLHLGGEKRQLRVALHQRRQLVGGQIAGKGDGGGDG